MHFSNANLQLRQLNFISSNVRRTRRYIFGSITAICQLIKSVTNATIVHAWSSFQTDKIPLTIFGCRIKSCFGHTQTGNLWFGRTTESQVRFGITVSHLIGPITTVRFHAERQSFGTVERKRSTIRTVHELSTMCSIAQFKIAKLMGAFGCSLNESGSFNYKFLSLKNLLAYLSRLKICSCATVNINWILAWIHEQFNFIVEHQSVWAQFFLWFTVGTFNISVTLSGHRIASISFGARAREWQSLNGRFFFFLQ